MKQNITLSLDREILRKVKILAAKKDVSITRLLVDDLVRLVAEENDYRTAKKRALARRKKGFHLGGRVLASREELHERR